MGFAGTIFPLIPSAIISITLPLQNSEERAVDQADHVLDTSRNSLKDAADTCKQDFCHSVPCTPSVPDFKSSNQIVPKLWFDLDYENIEGFDFYSLCGG